MCLRGCVSLGLGGSGFGGVFDGSGCNTHWPYVYVLVSKQLFFLILGGPGRWCVGTELRWRCFWYGNRVKKFALFALWGGGAWSWVFSDRLCHWRLFVSLFVSLSDCSHESGTFLGEPFVLHF